jgi:hypothetical protein
MCEAQFGMYIPFFVTMQYSLLQRVFNVEALDKKEIVREML